nr:HU family DNA-binding protein [Bacteroides intestinalis]
MSIVYDWYENPNAEGDPEERGLHPRPLLNGKVTMKQLYARVHARSSLTTGDVMNAIDCLTQICGEELREGREVHIEGLGYFSPKLEATQKVTRSTPNKHLKVRLKSISFRPDVNLKSALTGITATRSKLPTPLGSGDRHAPERILHRT